MSVDPPDYDKKEQEAWLTNAADVTNQLQAKAKDIAKKILTYQNRFDYSHDEITNKIRNDEMFAAFFAKEPRRQSFHEKIAAKWLQNLADISKFRVLPKSGENALYITSDGKIQTWDRSSSQPPSKSLDFMWRTGAITCYAMHKYTKEGGGNQDSQYKEMVDLLRKFSLGAADEKCVLFVIVDGPYYDKGRMKNLLRVTRDRPPCSYALPIQDVPAILATYKSQGRTHD